jgi:serine/threonine-protein kinase
MQFPDESAAGGSTTGGSGDPASDATVISSGTAAGAVAARPPAASTAEIGVALQGTMLGPYRLESFVGGGGMGAVFRAHDTTLDRVVAVKVLSRAQSADDDMLRRFRNEAQSAARLDHENIGRVHAVGSDQGWHYIVFEFIEGRNLRDLVREEGPFAVGRAIDVSIQVSEALEHAAERDVVHRDIKPSNIVITPAGRARIVDMGLARLAPAAGDADLTASGMTLGTFDYISPEQARDPRAADVRSDLYSLGCTLFFMLAGRAPFAEGTMVQKLLQHQQDAPPDITAIRADVPERLAAILARLMAKDPNDRYQRPAVLAADLAACAEEHGIELTAPVRAMAVVAVGGERRTAASALPWLVPLVGLLITVAALWIKAAADRVPADAPATRPADPAAGDG